MARRPWWPTSLADQIALLNNFSAKMGTYTTVLGWTPAQLTAANKICMTMVQAQAYFEASKLTMMSVTQWRDSIFNGEPVGASAGPLPTFGTGPSDPFDRGCVQQFSKLRDQILANNAYTTAIGEDLGLIGAEITPPSPESVSPNLKISVTEGESVTVSGSMQGMNALKMMYTPKGGTAREVAFFTSTPAGFTITKTQPGVPENGELRAVFYKKNVPYGTQSPIYPITLT